jgi:hypothetical protein
VRALQQEQQQQQRSDMACVLAADVFELLQANPRYVELA